MEPSLQCNLEVKIKTIVGFGLKELPLTVIIWFLLGIQPMVTNAQDISELDPTQYPDLSKCRYYNEVDPNRDSLFHYAQKAYHSYEESNDLAHAWSAYYLASVYIYRDSTEFRNYLDLFESKMNAINLTVGSIYAQIAKAKFSRKDFNLQAAIDHVTEALTSIDKVSTFTSKRRAMLKALCYSLKSSSYYSMASYMKALDAALKAQEEAEISEDPLRLVRACQNLSAVYGDLSSEEKQLGSPKDREEFKVLAEEYMVKAYKMAEAGKIPRMFSISAYNLSVYYAIDKQLHKADTLVSKVIASTKGINFNDLLFNALQVKGDIMMELNQQDSARYYYLESERVSDLIGSKYFKLKAAYAIGNYYRAKGQLDRARDKTLQGLDIAQSDGYLKWERQGYEILYSIEEEAGNYEAALKYFKEFETTKDSLLSQESISAINELKEKYEADLKASEIESLKTQSALQELRLSRKNLIIGCILILACLLGVIGYIMMQRRTLRAKKKANDAKQKLLRAQLNPHFLFNVLNAIQQFIYLKKDPELVADLLAKYSRLTRNILQYTREDFITLKEEKSFLKDYLDLQQIRFDIPFIYTIEVDRDLDENDILIPPMFSQAFVENSIEHGIMNKREQGEIKIQFRKHQDMLKIVLEDNGVGREKAEFYKRNQKHRSLATQMTKERLKLLEKKFKKNTSLVINDLTNKQHLVTGTRVVLSIPYLEE